MITNKQVKKILLRIFKIINPINKIIYKNPRKIVIYSNLGFRDNVKAVFDYLIDNNYNENYKIICSINDFKKYKNYDLKNVTFTSNFFGIYYFLTSKYFFYCFGKYPIKPSKYQIVVNLWHGTPLKRIGNMEDGKEHEDYNYFTYVLATSNPFKSIMMKSFRCSEENVLICGHPRNDILFNKSNKNKIKCDKKLIIWLPTFRHSEIIKEDNSESVNVIPIFENNDSIERLNRYLQKSQIHLIIKLHPIQNVNGVSFKNYSNLEILTNQHLKDKKIDLYELLSMSDALITDYSSVYFDYLLLNRPIAFTVDDIDSYGDRRGFVFENPEDYMPGEKIKNEKQFFEFLDKINLGRDEYELERAKINDYANYYKDGENSKRIIDMVGIK